MNGSGEFGSRPLAPSNDGPEPVPVGAAAHSCHPSPLSTTGYHRFKTIGRH